jgi:hypothetical protein
MRRVANGRAPTLLGRLFGLLLILLCIWTGVENNKSEERVDRLLHQQDPVQ